jgi:hypothetical protein
MLGGRPNEPTSALAGGSVSALHDGIVLSNLGNPSLKRNADEVRNRTSWFSIERRGNLNIGEGEFRSFNLDYDS